MKRPQGGFGIWLRLLAFVLAALALTCARAGRSCELRAPEAIKVQRALELAATVDDALEHSGAQVVVLARAGQDLSRYGLRWSHLGWAYREGTGDATAGVWRVVHKLNHCGSTDAALYRQGLAEFLLDDPFEYRVAFAVPTSAVQARLLPMLRDTARVTLLNEPAYNMLAYPWSTRYQQSNQWAIETLAAALDDNVHSRAEAQVWLQQQAYRPTTLHLDTLTRLGARLTAANIAFDDHPNDKRFSGRIETVTADSIFAWLQQRAIVGATQELR